MARKGWLRREDVMNTLSLEAIQKALARLIRNRPSARFNCSARMAHVCSPDQARAASACRRS